MEEIAYENGWITREQLMESAERYGKSPYGQHLKGLADGEIMLVPNRRTDVMRRLQSASSRQSFLPVCPSPVVPDIRFPIFKCSNDVLIQLAT